MKKIIITGIIFLILIGTVVVIRQHRSKVASLTPNTQQATVSASPSPTTSETSDINADIDKELNQLDKDIDAGSKEPINDTDLTF